MALQPALFPEIEGPDFVRDEAIADVGQTVLAHHGMVGGPLFAVATAVRDEEVRILWLRNDKPLDPDKDEGTHENVGRCVKAPGLWHDVTGYDIAIWLRGDFWDTWTPELREAFVLHELLHVEVTRDKDNQAKVATARHDVEDFVAVVRLYGPVVGHSAHYIRAATVRPADPMDPGALAAGMQEVADALGSDITVRAGGKSATVKARAADGPASA